VPAIIKPIRNNCNRFNDSGEIPSLEESLKGTTGLDSSAVGVSRFFFWTCLTAQLLKLKRSFENFPKS
jgi:hypothetical protein